VSFVSITQSFNTTSSMSRLTVNVLLSFAQFMNMLDGDFRENTGPADQDRFERHDVLPLQNSMDR
jgi:hypothetical protein